MSIIKKIKSIVKNHVGGIKKEWHFDSKSTLSSGPVIVNKDGNNEIIFGTKEGKIYAVDKDSKIKWIFDSQEDYSEAELMFLNTEKKNSVTSSPNIINLKDGKYEIVFATESGKVIAISNEGKNLWTFDSNACIKGNIIISDVNKNNEKEILFGNSDGNFYILNSNGNLIKEINIGTSIESTAVVFNNIIPQIIFGDNNGIIHSINFNGEKIWKFKTNNKIVSSGVISKLDKLNDSITIGSTDGILYNLDLYGNLIWKFKTNGPILSKPCIVDINEDEFSEIIFGSCDNSLYVLNNKGKKLWSYETDFWIVATPIVADIDNDGKYEIIVGSYDHNLYILDSNGEFIMDYMPGVSNFVNQTTDYSDTSIDSPGKLSGKKLWQYEADDMIVGCTHVKDMNIIIVTTKSGKLNTLKHSFNPTN